MAKYTKLQQSERRQMMRFHKFKTESELDIFLARYKKTVRLQISPNYVDLLLMALKSFKENDAEPWDLEAIDEMAKVLESKAAK